MFKLVILAKRKPGMSMQAFQDYYETRHAVLAISQSAVPLRRYVRNYLTPLQANVEAPFDCVTEVWFENEADFQCAMESLAKDPQKAAVIARDEENLFDRSTISFFTAVERETTLPS